MRVTLIVLAQTWKPLAVSFTVCIIMCINIGILNVCLFQGRLKSRCFDLDTGLLVQSKVRSCDLGKSMPRSIAAGTYACGVGEQCLPVGRMFDPLADSLNFDDTLSASLKMFQIFTLDSWADIMYATMDSCSFVSFSIFIIFVMIGPTLATNLFLAVITQRLKLVSNDQYVATVFKVEKRIRNPLVAKAFYKWFAHYRATEEGNEVIMMQKIDKRRLGEVRSVLVRLGCRNGLMEGINFGRAFNTWKEVYLVLKEMEKEELRLGVEKGKGRRNILAFLVDNFSLLRYRIKTLIRELVFSSSLEKFIGAVVLISTLTQALEHHPDSVPGKAWVSPRGYLRFHAALNVLSFVFTAVFVLELVLKVFVYGIVGYINKSQNLIDFAGMIEPL